MPFKSQKQRAFFGLCAAGKAKGKCPPKDVVDEFFKADRMDRMSAKGREKAPKKG